MLNRKYVNFYFIDNYIDEEIPQNGNHLRNVKRNLKIDSLFINYIDNKSHFKLQLASNQDLFDKFISECSFQQCYKIELFFKYYKEFYKFHKPEIDEISLVINDEFYTLDN